MRDGRIIRTLRMMAWERAKGELQFMLQTYWDDDDNFGKANKAVEDFIEEMESNGWQE